MEDFSRWKAQPKNQNKGPFEWEYCAQQRGDYFLAQSAEYNKWNLIALYPQEEDLNVYL